MPNLRKQIEQFGLMMAIRAVIHKHGCIPAGIANQLRFGELEEICYYIEDGNDGAEIKLGAFRYALELAGCFIDMQGLLKFNKLLALDAQLKKLALNKMLDFVDVTETKHQTLTVFEKARITFDEADKFKVMDVAVAAYQKMCKSASSFYQYLSVLENKLASEQTKEEFLKKAIAVAKDYWEWMNVYKLCVPGSDDEKLALKGLDEATVDLGELKEHIYQFPRGRWMDALIRKFLQLKPCFNDVNKLFGIFFHYGMSFYM